MDREQSLQRPGRWLIEGYPGGGSCRTATAKVVTLQRTLTEARAWIADHTEKRKEVAR